MTTQQRERKSLREQRKRKSLTEQRVQILAIAHKAFAQNGYARTSMEAIASDVGVSVGLLYLRFKSKEKLYLALLDGHVERLIEDMRRPTTLRSVWNCLCAWADGNIELARALVLSYRRQPTNQHVEAILARMTNAIRVGQAAGVYRHMSPRNAANMAWLLFLGWLQQPDRTAMPADDVILDYETGLIRV